MTWISAVLRAQDLEFRWWCITTMIWSVAAERAVLISGCRQIFSGSLTYSNSHTHNGIFLQAQETNKHTLPANHLCVAHLEQILIEPHPFHSRQRNAVTSTLQLISRNVTVKCWRSEHCVAQAMPHQLPCPVQTSSLSLILPLQQQHFHHPDLGTGREPAEKRDCFSWWIAAHKDSWMLT